MKTEKKIDEILRKWEPEIEVPVDLNMKIFQRIDEASSKRGLWMSIKNAFKAHRLISTTVMSVFVVFVLGGFSYAAETSVPGDLLYPMKIYVNEPVMAQIQFTKPSKANWEIQMADRRVDEAQILHEQGRFQGHFQDDLKKNWEHHMNNAKFMIILLEENSQPVQAEIIRVRFENAQELHQQMMQNFCDGSC